MRERGVVRTVSDPYLGDFDIPGPLARFSGWQVPKHLKADLLGEHNEEILRAYAGLRDDEIATLYQQGVLVRDRLLNGAETAPAAPFPTT